MMIWAGEFTHRETTLKECAWQRESWRRKVVRNVLIHVCLFINKLSLHFSFRLV